jgi:hypothetical protein
VSSLYFGPEARILERDFLPSHGGTVHMGGKGPVESADTWTVTVDRLVRVHRPDATPWFWLALVAGSVMVATVVVAAAGGTKTPWPHLFYVPVVFAALMFGLKGGFVAGLAAGVACGPLMPLDVDAGIAQSRSGWLIRLGFFVGIGLLTGAGRDRLLALADAHQKFLSGVSHELRTPLTAVLGFSELVLANYDALSDAEHADFATLIYQEATELANVIDHYVLAGRLDHHQDLVVETAAVDLDRVIQVVLAGVPPQIRDEGIVVRGEPLTVNADPLRVRQIVRALINNALAYGGQPIIIETSQSGHTATITIHDQGQTPRSVRYGNQVAGVPAPPLGVGLAVAKQLATLMHGELSYELNRNMTFQLRLPLAGHRRNHRFSIGTTTGRTVTQSIR